MASLKLVRSSISRISFDSWFQAIGFRQWQLEIIVRTRQIIVMNFRGSMKLLPKVCRSIIIEYLKNSAIKENLQTDSRRSGSTYMTCIIIMSISSITSFKPKSNVLNFSLTQGWTIRGGGGEAKYKKNICARGNQMKKNSCMPINPKKYSCYSLKKFIQGI